MSRSVYYQPKMPPYRIGLRLDLSPTTIACDASYLAPATQATWSAVTGDGLVRWGLAPITVKSYRLELMEFDAVRNALAGAAQGGRVEIISDHHQVPFAVAGALRRRARDRLRGAGGRGVLEALHAHVTKLGHITVTTPEPGTPKARLHQIAHNTAWAAAWLNHDGYAGAPAARRVLAAVGLSEYGKRTLSLAYWAALRDMGLREQHWRSSAERVLSTAVLADWQRLIDAGWTPQLIKVTRWQVRIVGCPALRPDLTADIAYSAGKEQGVHRVSVESRAPDARKLDLAPDVAALLAVPLDDLAGRVQQS